MINNVVGVITVPRQITASCIIIANMAQNMGAFPVSVSLMGFLLLYSYCWNKFKLVFYDWSFGLYLNEIVTWSTLFGLFWVIGAARAVSE
jgi:hypothetical protein